MHTMVCSWRERTQTLKGEPCTAEQGRPSTPPKIQQKPTTSGKLNTKKVLETMNLSKWINAATVLDIDSGEGGGMPENAKPDARTF